MKNKREFKEEGITLVALIITIIILLILAGIALSQLQENGIFDKAKTSANEYAEKSAKEKLEIKLSSLIIDKQTDSEYNENEYLTNKLKDEGFKVNGNVVTVDGEELGVISDVIFTGANDVYAVKDNNGKEILIPVIKDCIVSVDVENNLMTVKLLEGLR